MALSNDDERPAVILDTNTLIYSASKPFDIAHQLKIMGFSKVLVPSSVLCELRTISAGKSKKLGKFAKLAIAISASFQPINLKEAGHTVDEEIINAAKAHSYVVATSDTALRRRLRTSGIAVLYLKDDRLINEGEV